MLLREAAKLAHSAPRDNARTFALLCSFEPLHLKTYLQAFCARRFPSGAPEVETFGFDQLRAALERTSSELKNSPAALLLSWDDIHPGLTWRSRGPLGGIPDAEIIENGRELKARLAAWVRARPGLSLVVLPPREWLPIIDPCPPGAAGASTAAANTALWDTAHAVAQAGGRILEQAPCGLNYRDLLLAGHPLPLEQCALLAERLVTTAYPSIERKKALVVDLDGTLWSGVIGEDGPQKILCRSEGPGSAFHVFQKFIAKLRREGVLLAFCSKNNPEDVLPVFDSLDMPLKLADFTAYRCNWDPKSANLRALARELNIGTDALVFVDDNEAELAEVRTHLPEAAALGVPREGRDWPAFFGALQGHFGAWRIGDEDRLRSDTLSARRESSKACANGAGHLRGLELKLLIDTNAFLDPRCLELVNKTNQFNLTGERLSQDEWLGWASAPRAFCTAVRLADRFGDFGTVCVVAGTVDGEVLRIRQFVLSCRAFGRCIEILALEELLRRSSARWIQGPFKSTGKNEPARRFLTELGGNLTQNEDWRIDRTRVAAAARLAAEQSGAVVATKEGRRAPNVQSR